MLLAVLLSLQLAAAAPAQLEATTIATYTAPEADQGVAVDGRHFYAVDNSVIAKYRRQDGARLAAFESPKDGPIRHMNSCYARQGRLHCANSNYPQVPHGSSVEIFDTRTMTHVASHSLGLMDEGSLTFTDEIDGGYIAGFAHYSKNGGLAFKGAEFSSVVTFDDAFRRTGGYLFPATVLARMAPYAASGGAIGPDGLLYVMGHDLPEMYVLARPAMGPVLEHVATIALEAEGQAFSFDPAAARDVFVVDRRVGRVRAIRLPTVDAPAARRFGRSGG